MQRNMSEKIQELFTKGIEAGIRVAPASGSAIHFASGKPITAVQKQVALDYERAVTEQSERHGMGRREFIRSPLALSAGVLALASTFGISLMPNRAEAARNPLQSTGGNLVPGIGRIDFANPLVPIPDFDSNSGYEKLDVDGKVALVIGASSGIGKGAAQSLKERGFLVVGTSRKPKAVIDPPAIDALWELELTSNGSITSFVNKVKRELGGIDLLVLNAGRYIFGRVQHISLTQSKELYQTNVWGHHQLFQELAPLFPTEGYARVFLTSSSSDPGYAGFSLDPQTGQGIWNSSTQPYTASKAALSRLGMNIWTDQQQNALIGEPSNICVSVLYPPSVSTRLAENAFIADDPDHPLVAQAIALNESFLRDLGLDPLLAGDAYGQMAQIAEPFLDAYIYDQTLIPDPENHPKDFARFLMQQLIVDLNVQHRARTFKTLE